MRLCNTPGNPGNLLEICKVSQKLSDSVRLFVFNVTDDYCIEEVFNTCLLSALLKTSDSKAGSWA